MIPELYRRMWFSKYAPVITISGLGKKRITKVFPVVDRVISERRKRVPTAELNRFFRGIVGNLPLPQYKGRPVKLYYMTQVKDEPPAFVIFANYPDAVKDSQLRFIERSLRESFTFEGTPVRIYVRARRRE